MAGAADGADGSADRAAEMVALLAEDTVTRPGDDLMAAWRRLRAGTDRGHRPVAQRIAGCARLRPGRSGGGGAGLAPIGGSTVPSRAGPVQPARRATARPPGGAADVERLLDDLAAGLLVGLAHPERLARVRRAGGSSYLMAGGTAAELAPGAALVGSGWLAVAVADRSPGAPTARVRLATALDEATAREAGGPLLREEREIGWSGAEVVAGVTRLGAIELVERPLTRPDPERVAEAV
jgi:ATP-dependent helicase HrpB